MSTKQERTKTSASRTSTSRPSGLKNQMPQGLFKELSSSLVYAPLKFLNLVTVNGVSALRAYARHLVPIFVCLFLVPIAVCLSLFAGWKVWRSLSVNWEAPLYLQYGQRAIPYALTAITAIQASQPYDISLHLTLPVSDANMSLGNFMTTLILMTPLNRTIASVSRPAMVLPPKSTWIFGAPNIVALDMPLFTSFVPRMPDILAYVEIGRQDGWKSIGDGYGREVSVLSATLHGREVPHGLRGLAIRFPLVASSLAACIFLLVLSLMMATFILPTFLPIPIDDAEPEEQSRDEKKFKTDSSSSHTLNSRARSSSAPLRRRRSQTARRLSGSSRGVASKVESSTEDAPIALIPRSENVTEASPEASSHIVGLSGIEVRQNLRRRASRTLEGSDGTRRDSGTESGI